MGRIIKPRIHGSHVNVYNFNMFVGITVKENENDFYITKKIPELVIKRGAFPIMLPGYNDNKYVEQLSNVLSGLILSGGGDVDPALYNESNKGSKDLNRERDEFEIKLIRELYNKNKPILAICRGMQVLNVAFGGTLIQHVEGHYQKESREVLTHEIFIRKGTRLHGILGKDRIKVNSFHHQAIKDVAPFFVVSAVSDDGIIEAIEHTSHKFILGVQFHPEYMHEKEPFSRLFNYFIESLL